MPAFFRIPALIWPLPALLSWATAWGVYVALARVLPWWAALVCAGLLGTAASLWGGTWWRRAMIAAGFPLSWLVLSASSLPGWGWLLPLALLLLVYPVNAWRDAPLFPTPRQALDGLADVAPLAAQTTQTLSALRVLDAGCGLGDGLVALRRAYPQARIDGVEWSRALRLLCALRCPWAHVQRGDMWGVDWGHYALVYLFQRPESMARAAAKASAEMAPGAWLVSLEFAVPGVQPQAQLPLGGGRVLWVYRLPLQATAPD